MGEARGSTVILSSGRTKFHIHSCTRIHRAITKSHPPTIFSLPHYAHTHTIHGSPRASRPSTPPVARDRLSLHRRVASPTTPLARGELWCLRVERCSGLGSYLAHQYCHADGRMGGHIASFKTRTQPWKWLEISSDRVVVQPCGRGH